MVGIAQAAALLHHAQYAIALTGAGVSTPSGIPDFRSAGSGLWEHDNPMEVASLSSFRRHPDRFYRWIVPLARTLMTALPNAAHLALAELEKLGFLKSIITQNIDMLHSRAGSQVVYEVHGHLREVTCIECFRVYPARPFLEILLASDTPEIPRCETCQGVLKPNTILFGEQLPYQALNAAERDTRRCDVMLVAGSSLEVYPIADLPRQAKAHGAHLIIINYEPTSYDRMADIVIHGDVATVLPQLVGSIMHGV
jgi:NAD-dependent deacetylase